MLEVLRPEVMQPWVMAPRNEIAEDPIWHVCGRGSANDGEVGVRTAAVGESECTPTKSYKVRLQNESESQT